VKYFDLSPNKDGSKELLVVSTDDGRVIFYSTGESSSPTDTSSIPDAKVIGQLGGKSNGLAGRIKDFEVLGLANVDNWKKRFLLVTSSSDGVVRLWSLSLQAQKGNGLDEFSSQMLDSYETGNRITCMVAFAMQKPRDFEAIDESDSGSDNQDEEEESSSDSDQD
jgi:protein MAK11